MVAIILCMLIVWLIGMLVGMIIESVIENTSVAQSADVEATEPHEVQIINIETKKEECDDYFKDF